MDVLEEFVRSATTHWHNIHAKMESIDTLLAKIEDGTTPPDFNAPQFFCEFQSDTRKWRLVTESELAAKANGICFSFEGAFYNAGFEYGRNQREPSANLPFRIFEQSESF